MSPEDEPTIKEALDASASAIKNGDLETGKAGLKWVLKREPDNVLAWLWMSRCVESADAKLKCFNHVLAVDPTNKHALEGIQRFGGEEMKDDTPASLRVSSAVPFAQDSIEEKKRVPRLVVLGGILVAVVLLIGIIAVIWDSKKEPELTPEEELLAYMLEINPILQEWDDAVEIANSTPRMSLPDRVSELQDIRRQANNLLFESPGLTAAHRRLVKAMDYQIDAFLAFLAQDSDREVSAAFDQYDREIQGWEKDLEVFGYYGDR